MNAAVLNPTARRVLENAAKGQAFHAYLVTGPKGSGKLDFARTASAALLCTGEQKPCGKCGVCMMVRSGNHPDLITITTDGKSIKIGAIRTLLEELCRQSFLGGERTVVIDGAEDMTTEAQNCLLKTLEEPPSGTHFFLLAEYPEAMLPTIRSRCVHIRMTGMAEDALAALLEAEGAGKEEARLIARLSNGMPGQARTLLADKNDEGRYWNIRKQAAQLVASLKNYANIPKWEDCFKGYKDDREGAAYLLECMNTLYRDMLMLKTDAEALCINIDFKEKLGETARRFTKEALSDIIKMILLAQKQLKANVNYLLAADALLLSIAEVLNGKDNRRRAQRTQNTF